MADYHPLDVRYKGASNAYTGSAKKRAFEVDNTFDDFDPQDDTWIDDPAPTPKDEKPAQPEAGPWGNQQSQSGPWNDQQQQQQQQPAKRRTMTKSQLPNLAAHLLIPWPLRLFLAAFRKVGVIGFVLIIFFLVPNFLAIIAGALN